MHTAVERPDLWERGIDSALVWPEYNLHGDVLNQWWGLLDEELAELQFVLYDEAETWSSPRATPGQSCGTAGMSRCQAASMRPSRRCSRTVGPGAR
jgi:hypothetical protein